MGVANLGNIAKALLENGKDSSTPVAIIERGLRKYCRVTTGPLSAIGKIAIQAEVKPPGAIVIGDVVRLYDPQQPDSDSSGEEKMIEQIDRFERHYLSIILIVLLGFVLIFALIDMLYLIITSIITPPAGLLTNPSIVAILGAFLLVLITVELLDTMKAYIVDNVVHVEVVVLLAIIAIARKVICLIASARLAN